MIRLLLKQPLHIWRTLEKRHKIEAILLVLIIISYLTARLHAVFTGLLDENATKSGITLLAVNAFILQLSLSSMAVIQWVIPRQPRLRLFLTAPLSNRHVLQLLTYSGFKYLSAYLVLIIPFLIALAVIDLVFAVMALVMIVVLSVFYFWTFILLKQKYNRLKFLGIAISIILITHSFLGFIYWSTEFALPFQLLYFLAALIICERIYNYKDYFLKLESFVPFLPKTYKKKHVQKTGAFNFRWKFLPPVMQSLFEKESLALWRNPSYRKLKVYSLLVFLTISILILASNFESKGILLTLLTSLLIWVHYGNGFSEKYIYADPDWFIRTLPIRFRQLMLAKYFAEIPYVLILSFFSGGFLLVAEPGPSNAGGLFLMLLIFSHVVLFTMLNFQIMFYNDARLAGYAYHFTLLFVFIMVLNYRLVGPIITLALMLFFLYKNVKYFNN
ncbi:MAG: hypothetical protein KDF60_09840 [Calditrichaeota bacterium]|nr:hypothetical protein [Calditrichota bacterium]